MLKKLVLNLFFLLLLLIALNYLYKYTFLERDLQHYSSVINDSRDIAKQGSRIVYVGESSNLTHKDCDRDTAYISDYIAQHYPNLSLFDCTHPAFHAQGFYEILRNIPDSATVETVIVTMNLRSFGIDWIESKLENQMLSYVAMIRDYPPLLNRFMLSFKAYNKTDKERTNAIANSWENTTLLFPYDFPYKTVRKWDNAQADKGILNPDSSRNQELTELACHYIKTYAFQIDTLTNPRIKDFDNIVALAKKRHWNLVFNLLSENIEQADELVGKEIVYLIKQNRDLLLKRYNKDGVIVVDNLETVHNNDFCDRDWTTEHYAERGRRAVADKVALALKQFYPAEFKQVEVNKPYRYFNDCEEPNSLWKSTVFSEKIACSGKRASKIGNGNEFGITLEIPIFYLPDSIRSITINQTILQEDTLHDAKMICEISGVTIPTQWKDYKIKELTSEVNRWKNSSCTFYFDDSLYHADIIKLYVYNNKKTTIYVDDIEVLLNRP